MGHLEEDEDIETDLISYHASDNIKHTVIKHEGKHLDPSRGTVIHHAVPHGSSLSPRATSPQLTKMNRRIRR